MLLIQNVGRLLASNLKKKKNIILLFHDSRELLIYDQTTLILTPLFFCAAQNVTVRTSRHMHIKGRKQIRLAVPGNNAKNRSSLCRMVLTATGNRTEHLSTVRSRTLDYID